MKYFITPGFSIRGERISATSILKAYLKNSDLKESEVKVVNVFSTHVRNVLKNRGLVHLSIQDSPEEYSENFNLVSEGKNGK